VPELELVQVHLHAVTLPDLPGDLHLVLRDPGADYCQIPSHGSNLRPYLVLRVAGEDSGYSRNDYDGFRLHLVLHHIPGHSRQRGRPIRRCDRRPRLRARDRRLPPPRPIVVGVPGSPRLIRAAVPHLLTSRRATRVLPATDPRVRQEPTTTHRTRPLLAHDPATIAGPGASPVVMDQVGHFWRAHPGHFSRAVKDVEAAAM
jgi:hypothetical protein